MYRDIMAKSFLLFIFFFIFSALILGDGDVKLEKQRPNAAERAIGSSSSITTTAPTSPYWNKIRLWINVAWMNLRHHHGQEIDKGRSSLGAEVMKDVTKSLETSKAAVEDAAKLASEIAGDAVHKTVEKVKKTVSDSGDDLHTEL